MNKENHERTNNHTKSAKTIGVLGQYICDRKQVTVI